MQGVKIKTTIVFGITKCGLEIMLQDLFAIKSIVWDYILKITTNVIETNERC